jgi:hypothetical protein
VLGAGHFQPTEYLRVLCPEPGLTISDFLDASLEDVNRTTCHLLNTIETPGVGT